MQKGYKNGIDDDDFENVRNGMPGCIGSHCLDYSDCLPGSSSEEPDHEEIGGRAQCLI